MGKKAKTKKGELRAQGRKPDPKTLPPPPPPVDQEIGSKKLLSEPKVPGTKFKVLDKELDGFDDGGVADLTLIIDLEDHALRRKRGEMAYFTALNNNVLPKVLTGQLANLTRRDQKVHLATLLFSDGDVKLEDDEDSASPSEVYMDTFGQDDEQLRMRREERLRTCKHALKLSMHLREPACAAVALTEIGKRILLLHGRKGGEDALRCATKSIEMASDGCYDNEDILVEADEVPKIDPKVEKNATFPCLQHPTSLKYYPKRTAELVLRAAYLHQGNALSALDRHDEAIAAYEKSMPYLEAEPRCARIDWERSSVLVNIGNCYSRLGKFDLANQYFDKAEQLGVDHLEAEHGDKAQGLGIRVVAMRARAFSLKKQGKEDEAKTLLRQVLTMQQEFNEFMAKERSEMKAELEEQKPEPTPPQVAAS